jgi:hypothetical protein
MARKPGPKKKRGPKPKSDKTIGRPTKMTKETISKLEEVFSLGGTDEEACLFANISIVTLYAYQKINPDFTKRKELLKKTPILEIRRVIIDKAKESYDNAIDFMERKNASEFKKITEPINPLLPENNKINILINNLNLNEKDFEREKISDTIKILAERIIEQGEDSNGISNG